MFNKLDLRTRAEQYRGFVGIVNNSGSYGVVQYYWNYYQGTQIIVVVNEAGVLDFQKESKKFCERILDQLKINPSESVEFYAQTKAEVIQHETLDYRPILWRRDNFHRYDHIKGNFISNNIPSEAIVQMIKEMNLHASSYELNRRAFAEPKNIINIKWEALPSLKCIEINRS